MAQALLLIAGLMSCLWGTTLFAGPKTTLPESKLHIYTAFRAYASLELIGAVCAEKRNVDSWSGGCAPVPHTYTQIRVCLRIK